MIESAAIGADGDCIEAHHLPREVRERIDEGAPPGDRYRADEWPDERTAILAALEAAGGSRARAAAMLGMGRTTLWQKIKQYGIAVAIEPMV